MANDIIIQVKADTSQLKKAETHLKLFGEKCQEVVQRNTKIFSGFILPLASIRLAFQGLGTAINNFVIAPLAGAVSAFVEFGDQLSKTSQRIGMSVETLGGLKYAAEQCGSNFEEMTDAVKTFQEQLGAAKLGDTGAIGKLGAVGIRAEDFDGLSSEEQFLKLADHIRQIGDRAEQTRTAIELFGDAGFRLLPFFQEGKEGIRKLIEEGESIGAVLGKNAVSGAVELSGAMNRLKTSAENLSNQCVSVLSPAITMVCSTLTYFLKVIGSICNSIGGGIVTLGAFTAAAAALLKVWEISKLISLTSALGALKGALMALCANPIILGIAGLTAAFVALYNATSKAADMTKKLKDLASGKTQSVFSQHEQDLQRFQRLRELANYSKDGSITNDEIREAVELAEHLRAEYGDIGIQIDENARKISGMEKAEEEFRATQKAQKISALEAEQTEAKANIEMIDKRIEEIANSRFHYRLEGDVQAELDSLYAAKEHQQKRSSDANMQILQLKGIVKNSEPDEDLSEANKSKRNAQAAAREKLAALPDDPDLDFRSDLEKAYAKLDGEVQKKYSELDKKIKLAEEAGVNTESLYDGYNDIERWRQEQLAEIHNNVNTKQQEQGDAEYAKWQEQNPELLETPSEDTRLTNAQKNVSAAEDAVAAAVLNGGNVEAADEGLRKAKLELAQTVAEVSGEARAKAKKEYDALQNEYELAKERGAGNDELNQLWKALEEAGKRLEEENSKYFSAVAEIRGLRPDEPLPEEEVQDAVSTSMRVSGSFSAYGLEAAAAGTNIAMETLDYIKKIFGQVEEVKNNQTAGVLE